MRVFYRFSILKIPIIYAFNRKITFNTSFRSHCTTVKVYECINYSAIPGLVRSGRSLAQITGACKGASVHISSLLVRHWCHTHSTSTSVCVRERDNLRVSGAWHVHDTVHHVTTLKTLTFIKTKYCIVAVLYFMACITAMKCTMMLMVE